MPPQVCFPSRGIQRILWIAEPAFSGIGRGSAVTIAREGCRHLFLADIDLTGLEETKKQAREANPAARVEIERTDISNEESVKHMIDSCVSLFGRVDYALNIAGVVPQRKGIAELEVETYDRTIRINHYGVSSSLHPCFCFSAERLSPESPCFPLINSNGCLKALFSFFSDSSCASRPGYATKRRFAK